MSALDRIAASTREHLAARKARRPAAALARACQDAPPTRSFAGAFAPGSLGVIAEIKLASPSRGWIRPGADPAAIASSYLANGAAAISVLTEERHFQGSLASLAAVRRAFPGARLLMKDFVLDPYQLHEARYHGADAALLMISLLGRRAAELLGCARDLGLDALVEVHDQAELAIAEEIGADLIGVNNRDLRTLAVSLDASFRLAPRAPAGARLISESGIQTAAEARRLQEAGFSGILVGTALMSRPDPGQALAELRGVSP